jgi:hypothetical protein
MRTSARSAASLLLAVAAAAALDTSARAAAQPADVDASGASPAPPVIRTIDGIWNAYVPPNAFVPRSPVGTFAEPFLPTTSQMRDFFGFIQQIRPPAG